MLFLTTLVFSVVSFSFVQSANLPAIFRRCKVKESNFNECLRESIEDAIHRLKAGLPNFNIPPLDPLVIPSVTIPGGSGSVNVVQKYKNFVSLGFANLHIERVDANLNENYLNFDVIAPNIVLEAEYDFDGRVLLLPVKGKGPSKITFGTIKAAHRMKFERYRKKGDEYIRIVDYKVDLLAENVHFQFDNLFNGDKQLGDTLNKVVNDNSEDVFNDVKNGYGETYAAVFKDFANKIFNKVPLKKLFDFE